MKKDAEVHAAEDKKKREAVDTRNQADALVFNLEKQMREHDSKIPDATKKKVNTGIAEVKELLRKDNASPEEIKKATEKLSTDAQEIGKIIYEAAQKKEAKEGPEGKGGKAQEKKVVEGEVVDKE